MLDDTHLKIKQIANNIKTTKTIQINSKNILIHCEVYGAQKNDIKKLNLVKQKKLVY